MIHSVSSATYLVVSLPVPVADATLQITAKAMYATKSTGSAREPSRTPDGGTPEWRIVRAQFID
jgi:hypothetical protein